MVFSRLFTEVGRAAVANPSMTRGMCHLAYRAKYNEHFSESQKEVLDSHSELVQALNSTFLESIKAVKVTDNAELRTMYAGEPQDEKSMRIWELEIPDPNRRKELVSEFNELKTRIDRLLGEYEAKVLPDERVDEESHNRVFYEIHHVKRTVVMCATRNIQEDALGDSVGVERIHEQNKKSFGPVGGTIIGRCPIATYKMILLICAEQNLPLKEFIIQSTSKKRELGVLTEQMNALKENVVKVDEAVTATPGTGLTS